MNESTSEERTMSLVAHLLGIVTWFIGPLIIWLINKDKDPGSFVVDQSKEALNFQITITIAFAVLFVLTLVTLGLASVLIPVLGIVNVVFCILAAVKANTGERYRYPFALRLIK